MEESLSLCTSKKNIATIIGSLACPPAALSFTISPCNSQVKNVTAATNINLEKCRESQSEEKDLGDNTDVEDVLEGWSIDLLDEKRRMLQTTMN